MFKIVTDSNCDLPEDYYDLHKIGCLKMSYIIDGVVYGRERHLPYNEFYDMMRNGKMPTTSPATPDEAREMFEEALLENNEVLCLAFSSGLSVTYNSVQKAANDLMKERPGTKIIVVDTLSASLGEGLLVHKAVELRDAGYGIDEVAEWIRSHISNVVQIFTVNDLFHLQRGGRVGKATAIIGSIVGIKPTLHVDDAGKLVSIDKIRGRKKALQSLVDYMETKTRRYMERNDIVCVSHGDDSEAAEYVCDLVRERFGIQNFLINNIGPSIGTHAGPGVVCLFFMGTSR